MPDESPFWGDWSAAEVVRHTYRRLARDQWSCVKVSEELNALGVPTTYVRDGRGIRGKRTAGLWRANRIRNLVVSTIYRGEFQYGKRTARKRERDPGSLLDELQDEANSDRAAAVIEASRMTLQAALDALGDRRKRRLEQHERGLIADSELESALEEIGAERATVEARLSELVPSASGLPAGSGQLGRGTAPSTAGSLSDRERQEVVRELVARIVVTTEVDEAGRSRHRVSIPPRPEGEPDKRSTRTGSECCSHYMNPCPCRYSLRQSTRRVVALATGS